MNAAYITTVGKIRKAINENDFRLIADKILEGCNKFLLITPSNSEIQSWENSIPPFINALSTTCDSLPIIIEFKMPIGNERADLVLLGGDDRAIVIELKHWGKSKISKYKARNMAYEWLSKQMNIPLEFTHIAMFNVEQCKIAIKKCKPYYGK